MRDQHSRSISSDVMDFIPEPLIRAVLLVVVYAVAYPLFLVVGLVNRLFGGHFFEPVRIEHEAQRLWLEKHSR